VSHGGSHKQRNVQLLCRECNIRKGATTRGQLSLYSAATNAPVSKSLGSPG
jgi:5-methylcytosine-specific restriction endonuclease McrA